MITKSKNTWEFGRKRQKNNKLYCYLALNRDYEMATYLSSVRDIKQRQLRTKDRLGDHALTIEKGSHKSPGYRKNTEYVNSVRQVIIDNERGT